MHKYHAIPTTVDNIRFASKAEAQRYAELRLLEKAGEIKDLRLQPVFDLWAFSVDPSQAERVGAYVADFAYENRSGDTVVEDVKGVKTALYRWKKKHFEAQYGLSITEIGRPSRRRGVRRRKPLVSGQPGKSKRTNASKNPEGPSLREQTR